MYIRHKDNLLIYCYNSFMKQFTSTIDKSYTFSNCSICPAKCCDGRQGTVFAQILLSDIEEVYKNFPVLFIYGELGYLKPVVLLTNGHGFCKYLKDFKCSIYENRPSICRVYPLSSNIDNIIYIDEMCPAINDKENSHKTIVENSLVEKDFDYPTLNNYQDKYIDTFREFDVFNKKEDFSLIRIIKGIEFYKYNIEVDNKYMKMHQESLIHLQSEYFIN